MKNEKIIILKKLKTGVWVVSDAFPYNIKFCRLSVERYIPEAKNMTYMELRITTTKPSGDNFFILVRGLSYIWKFSLMENGYNHSPWISEFDYILNKAFPNTHKLFVRIYGY